MSQLRVLLAVALDSEREWIAARQARFDEALAFAGGDLDAWLTERWVQRGVSAGGRVSFGQLRLQDPALAWAASRWLREHGHPLPSEATAEPQAHFPLTDDDWRLLVGDYVAHAPASDARQGVQRALIELEDPSAEVLRRSAVKPALVCDALAAEDEGRGGGLRAAVRADTEEQLQAVRAAIAADERLTSVTLADDADLVIDLEGDATAPTVWRIVAIDPTLPGGGPDYAAFAARAGDPARVDPALAAAGAPPEARFAEINLRQLDAATGGAMGAPEHRAPAEVAPQARPDLTTREKVHILRQAFGVFGWIDSWFFKLGALFVALLILAEAFDTAIFGIPAVVVAPVWIIGTILRASHRKRARRYQADLPVDWAAFAVCEAYVALGDLRRHYGLGFEPDASGTLRPDLRGVDDGERERVHTALARLLGPGAVPTWIVSRQVEISVGEPTRRAWYPVPEDFARDPQRRAAFTDAWRRWMGPGWLLEIREADLADPDTAALVACAQQPGGVDDGKPDLGDLEDNDSHLPPLPEGPRLLQDPVELT